MRGQTKLNIVVLIFLIRCFGYIHSNNEFNTKSNLKPCFPGVKDTIDREADKKVNNVEESRLDEEVTYTGAVLEYRPYDKWTKEDQGYGVVRKNAEVFAQYAVAAKAQGADIFITPEYGIQSLDMYYNDTAKFLTYTQYVPNPADKIIPCALAEEYPNAVAVQILSCAAADNKIYLVIDMAELNVCSPDANQEYPFPIEIAENCPEVGYFVYNTQVVFDREGLVVARYRKQNLYLEDSFTPGPRNDSTAIFVTDFNVAFSLEICFDIVYDHPAYSNVRQFGIRDVAMSTAWVDELPFDAADGIQNGWSRGLGANLLVAGHHIPEYNMLGSGIFKGFTDEMPSYIYDRKSGDALIVSNVRTIPASSLPYFQNKDEDTITDFEIKVSSQRSFETKIGNNPSAIDEKIMRPLLHTDLSNFTKVMLKAGEPNEVLEERVCDADYFCCHLKYEYSGHLIYMLVANSGQNLLGDDHYVEALQICGVVWCLTTNYKTCAVVEIGVPEYDSFGPFSLSSETFSAEVVYPIGLQRNLSLISNYELHFNKSNSYYSIFSESPVAQPLTLALYGRWFDNDISV